MAGRIGRKSTSLCIAAISALLAVAACSSDSGSGGGGSGSCKAAADCQCWECTCDDGSVGHARGCIANQCPKGEDICACIGGATLTKAVAVDASNCI